jgi:hypothetical protein
MKKTIKGRTFYLGRSDYTYVVGTNRRQWKLTEPCHCCDNGYNFIGEKKNPHSDMHENSNVEEFCYRDFEKATGIKFKEGQLIKVRINVVPFGKKSKNKNLYLVRGSDNYLIGNNKRKWNPGYIFNGFGHTFIGDKVFERTTGIKLKEGKLAKIEIELIQTY